MGKKPWSEDGRRARLGKGRPRWARMVLALLLEQGRTLTWLAHEVGITKERLSVIMATHRDAPNQAGLIAKALGVPFGTIFPLPCRQCGKAVYQGEPCDCK